MERLPSFAAHPTLGLNLAQPVSHRGNPAEVFENVLLADEPDWDYTAGQDRDRGAKDTFQHVDALGMVPEGPVPEVSHVGLTGVEPFVVLQILVRLVAGLLTSCAHTRR